MNIERLPAQVSNLSAEYQRFKEREDFSHALGIIGGSSEADLSTNKAVLLEACRLAQAHVGNFAIVSGGTKDGVPELALDIGRELGLPTIGVFPQEGSKHAAIEKLDLAIAVPPQPLSEIKWGSETATLVSLPDMFVLMGGKWGTLIEVSMIMKRNDSLVRHERSPVPIVTVSGSGDLADFIEDMTQVFPVHSGTLFQARNSDELAGAMVQRFQ